MTGRARRLRFAWLASVCGLSSVVRLAGAQQAPVQGPPPPGYYSAPAYPAPPPTQSAPPNTYPVSPRDYGAGPETLGFREGMFVPPGYHLGHRPHRVMLVAGVSLVSGAYLLGLTAGAFDGFDNQKGWLFLPVIGPWITSSRRRSCVGASLVTCTANDSSASFLLGADGVAQGVGALTILLAVAVQEKVLVRNDARVFVLPSRMANGAGAGLTAYGRF
jgi:hypothetical protein